MRASDNSKVVDDGDGVHCSLSILPARERRHPRVNGADGDTPQLGKHAMHGVDEDDICKGRRASPLEKPL